MVNTTDGVVVIPDGELAYWDTGGSGPVVVLLHPATGTAETWSPQREPLAAAGFRVIAYTRRGHLGSTPVDPEHPVPATEDLRALIGALGRSPGPPCGVCVFRLSSWAAGPTSWCPPP